MLDRRLATETICAKIAELVRGDDKMADRVVSTCQAAAEARQQPDP